LIIVCAFVAAVVGGKLFAGGFEVVGDFMGDNFGGGPILWRCLIIASHVYSAQRVWAESNNTRFGARLVSAAFLFPASIQAKAPITHLFGATIACSLTGAKQPAIIEPNDCL
jgi:hypothetical protein